MKKNNVVLFSLIFLFVIVTPFVFGANILDNVLQPFKGLDIGATYLRYATFIDAIIYFWFFIAVVKGIPNFKEKLGTGVATALGIILGIGMGVFEYTSHFNLGMLAPFAALIFFIVLGSMLFMWTKSMGDNGLLAFSLTFIIIYSLIHAIAKPLVAWIDKIPMLSTVLGILLIVSIIGLIMGLFRLIGSIRTGEKTERNIERTNKENLRKERKEKDEELKAIKKAEKAQEKILGLQRDMDRFKSSLANIEKLEKDYLGKDMLSRAEQIDIVKKLIPVLQKTYQAQQALTKIYDKINRPEYVGSQQEVMDAASQLDTLVQQIETMLLQLDTSIKNSDKSDSEMIALNDEFKAEFAKTADADIQQLKAVDMVLEAVKVIDEKEYYKIYDAVKKAHADTSTLLTMREDINKKEDSIKELDKVIKTIDDKNLTNIDRAITSLRANVEKDTSTINNTLNVISNGSMRKDIRETAEREGKFAGALEVIRQGRKYFSASSFRQVYVTVTDIYKTMSNELIPQITTRNNLMKEKITLVNNYKTMDAAALIAVKKAFNTELQASQKRFEDDRNKLIESLTNVDKRIITTDDLVTKLNASTLRMDPIYISANKLIIEKEITDIKPHYLIPNTAFGVSYTFATNRITEIHIKQIKGVVAILGNLLEHYINDKNDKVCPKAAADLTEFTKTISTINTDTAAVLTEFKKIPLFT